MLLRNPPWRIKPRYKTVQELYVTGGVLRSVNAAGEATGNSPGVGAWSSFLAGAGGVIVTRLAWAGAVAPGG